MSTKVGRNKYEEVKKIPVLDLVFTSSKKSLIDRVNDNGLQFTRNTIGTYVGADGLIKTAAAGEPRYTYDPETGEELGLLVEEQRENLLTQSEHLDSGWVYQGVGALAPTVTSVEAPDGGLDSRLYTLLPSPMRVRQDKTIPAAVYTLSVYYKPNATTILQVFLFNSAVQANVTFDTTDPNNPTVTSGRGEIVNVGNGWYRASVTTLTATDGTVFETMIYPYGGYLWGAQLEAGSYATSYIPTSGSTITRDPDTITLTNTNIYDNEKFDIINDPFGMSAGSDTLTLLPSASNSSAIKRATIFSPNIAQSKINTFAEKTDEFWRWRVTGSSFGLNQFSTDGQVTVDWDDGTVETLTTSDHTFTDGKAYHEIGFRLDSGTYMNILINSNAIHKDKVVAIGPAPESMVVNPFVGFKNCSNLVSFDPSLRLIELNSGQSATQAWLGCGKLKSFPLIDTSNITNFSNTWQGCTSLTSFPEINASNVTNFAGAWQSCSSLTSFPEIDTSNGINFSSAWIGCSSLTSFPEIDTSSGTNFFAAWDNCTNLQSFPEINTSNGTDFRYAWAFCSSLTSFPTLDISNGTTFQFAWNRCVGLTDFPANFFDNWTGTPANNCFVTTWNDNFDLTATSVENIYNSISVSPSSSTPPASGTNIDVDYSIGTGTPDIAVSAIDLTAKGWTPTLNGTAQTNPYSFASLDLDFATNKTLNDNISSSNLITFTRTSTATYVDSNGLIKTSPVNLLTYSSIDQPDWAATGTSPTVVWSGFTDPAGGTEAAEITFAASANSQIQQNVTGFTSGVTYTYSLHAKVDSGTQDFLLFRYDSANFSQQFTATTDWQRFEWTFVGAGGLSTSVRVRCVSPTGGETLLVWGAQLEEGSTATTYIKTTNLPSAAPRFDHDPATGESLGLLIEESRTNLFTNGSVPFNDGRSVSSTVNGIDLYTATGNVNTVAYLSVASSGNSNYFSITSGLTYTVSFYGKSGTSPTAAIRFVSNAGANLTNQVVLALPSDGSRVSCQLTANSSSILAQIQIASVVNGLTIEIGGLQVEAGSFPTSYIPTSGSTVTRAADVGSITGSNFSSWYNQSEGTIYSESYEAQGASLRTNYLIKSGDPLTRIQEVNNRFYNAASFVNLPTSSVPGQKYKVAFGLGNQPQTASSDGQPVVSLNLPISQEIDTLGLGDIAAPSGIFGSGHISRLTYWPKRLTDTSLQYLTQ